MQHIMASPMKAKRKDKYVQIAGQGSQSLLDSRTGTIFCWAAFMFMWTYTNGTVALNVFDTPVITTMTNGVSRVVLDTQSAQYQTAGDWVGILFAVQAIGSVIWATIIPMIQNRKLAYVLSLVLGGIGFISISLSIINMLYLHPSS